jgi:hypothetical protein
LAHEIQAALDGGGDGGEGLTYHEAGPLYGVFQTTIGRHMSLARLAPDIQKVVARLKTKAASEPIDRKKLEWVAEPVKWPEQRARFQKPWTGLWSRPGDRADRVSPQQATAIAGAT